MDVLITVIGIVIAARVISWPVAALSPLGGNCLFLLLMFIGAGHLFNWFTTILSLAGLFWFCYALGHTPLLPDEP